MGLQCLKKHLAVFWADHVIIYGVSKERGRRLVRYLFFVGEKIDEFSVGFLAE